MLPTVTVPTGEVKLFSIPKPVVIRPYLVKEEKLLLIAQAADDPKDVDAAVRQIVRNCTFDKVNPDTLPTFDLEYLFLQLRAKSVNNVIESRFRCLHKVDDKECGTPNDVKIDINDIKITVPEGHTNKVWLTDILGVTLKYPTANVATDGAQDIVSVLPKCLETVFRNDGAVFEVKDQTPEEVTEFVESLSLAQVDKIRAFFDTMPYVAHTFTFTCKKCGYSEEITLRGLQDFFD